MKTLGLIVIVVIILWLLFGGGLQTLRAATPTVPSVSINVPGAANNAIGAFKTVDLGNHTGMFTYLPGQNQMVVAAGYTDATGTCSVRHWWSNEQPVEIVGGQYHVVLIIDIMPEQMGPVLQQFKQEAESRLHTNCELR